LPPVVVGPPPPHQNCIQAQGDINAISCMLCANDSSFGQLILRKIIETVDTRCQSLSLKCTKFDFGWGSARDPAEGVQSVHSAPSNPLAGLEWCRRSGSIWSVWLRSRPRKGTRIATHVPSYLTERERNWERIKIEGRGINQGKRGKGKRNGRGRKGIITHIVV